MMVNLVDDERRFTRLDACNFFSKEDACKFAEKYYKTFIDSPGDIHTYYKDGSKIIRPGDVFFRKYTREEIKGKLLRHKYSEVKLDNEEIYVDYYSPGVEMVYVSGRLIEEDSTIERFTQTFLVEQHKTKEGKYFVVCDKFNTLGKDGVSESDVDDNEDGYSVENSDIDTDEEQVFTTRTHAELGDPRDGSVIDEEPELPNFYEKFDQYQQSSKKKGSPKRVRDEADSGNESRNMPGKELLRAGDGKKLASTFIPSKRESENVFGRNKSKVKKVNAHLQLNACRKSLTGAREGLETRMKVKRKTKICRQNNANLKQRMLSIRRSQMLRRNRSPKRPRNAGESGDEGQNMLSKELLEAGDGKSSDCTSISSGTVDEWPPVGLKKTKIKKKNKLPFSPKRPRVEGRSGIQRTLTKESKFEKGKRTVNGLKKPENTKTERNRSEFVPSEEHTLDLHICENYEDAELAAKVFLRRFSSPQTDVTVRVITGRGKHSKDNKAIIKPKVLKLFKELGLEKKLVNKGGAVDITIREGRELSLSDDENHTREDFI